MDYFENLGLPEKKKKILESATWAFSKKGYHAITTRDIAKCAGISEGCIYSYYHKKKDILSDLLKHALNILKDNCFIDKESIKFLCLNETDKYEILRILLRRFIVTIEHSFPLIKILVSEAFFHEYIREEIINKVVAKWKDAFQEIFYYLKSEGLIREGIELESMLKNMIGHVFAFIILYSFSGEVSETIEYDLEIDKLCNVLLYGVSK